MESVHEKHKLKASIELEGELDSLLIKAKLANTGTTNLTLNYIIETHSRNRINKKKTLQRGKCISPKQSVVYLSESRMNLSGTDELCVHIKIFDENKIVAVDSVMYHGAK